MGANNSSETIIGSIKYVGLSFSGSGSNAHFAVLKDLLNDLEKVDQENVTIGGSVTNPLGSSLIQNEPNPDKSVSTDAPAVPDMWSLDYIGLYSQYAAIGLIYGSVTTCNTFCPYVYNGQGIFFTKYRAQVLELLNCPIQNGLYTHNNLIILC